MDGTPRLAPEFEKFTTSASVGDQRPGGTRRPKVTWISDRSRRKVRLTCGGRAHTRRWISPAGLVCTADPQRRRLRRQRRRRYGVDLLYEAMARCGYCSADVAATNVELKSRTSISYFFRARYSTGSNYRKCCIFSANAVKNPADPMNTFAKKTERDVQILLHIGIYFTSDQKIV